MRIVILIMVVMFSVGCGQLDYEVGHRVVCGDDPGPCPEEDAGDAGDVDAGTDAE